MLKFTDTDAHTYLKIEIQLGFSSRRIRSQLKYRLSIFSEVGWLTPASSSDFLVLALKLLQQATHARRLIEQGSQGYVWHSRSTSRGERFTGP